MRDQYKMIVGFVIVSVIMFIYIQWKFSRHEKAIKGIALNLSAYLTGTKSIKDKKLKDVYEDVLTIDDVEFDE